jgi:tetratricopeptide (TPR) repeat protein
MINVRGTPETETEEAWVEDGPNAAISSFMESERRTGTLSPTEKTLLSFAFAIKGWSEEALEMREAMGSPTAVSEWGRGIALWKEGDLKEAIQALRSSLQTKEGRVSRPAWVKYDLGRALKVHFHREGVGKYVPSESEKDAFPLATFRPGQDHFDYRNSRYDEVKALYDECIEEAPDGGQVLGWVVVDRAVMERSRDQALEILRSGARKGSERCAYELSLAIPYLQTENQHRFGVRVTWSEAWEAFQEETAIENNGNVFEVYLRFAHLVEERSAPEEVPAEAFDLGMELIENPERLDCSASRVALCCGRLAALDGDLEIASMFYKEAQDGTGPLAEGIAVVEEAGLKIQNGTSEAHAVLRTAKEASEVVVENHFRDDFNASQSMIGIQSQILRYPEHPEVHVTNASVLGPMVEGARAELGFEARGSILLAAAKQLCPIMVDLKESANTNDFSIQQRREEVELEGALATDHPAGCFDRMRAYIQHGRYGKAVVERLRSVQEEVSSAGELEENRYLLSLGALTKMLEERLSEDELETERWEWTGRLEEIGEQAGLPRRSRANSCDEELYRESFDTLRGFIEGKTYADEIDRDLRPALSFEACREWKRIGERSPSGIKWRELASQSMKRAGDPDGEKYDRGIWAYGELLHGEMLIRKEVDDRSQWTSHKDALERVRPVGLGLQDQIRARIGLTYKVLGNYEKTRRWLSRVEKKSRDDVIVNVDGILQVIDRLKTAPDRWGDLGFYPRKLLAAITALNGSYDTGDLAQLSGQKEKFIRGHLETLLDEGMLERTQFLGNVTIQDVGTVRVNPRVQSNAEKERTHEIESRIIEADGSRHLRPVFDSEGEHKIYQTLTEVFPNGLVFPNMAPAAIFEYEEMKEELTGQEFTYFLQSRVDFCVVSTESYLPIVGIEVDSHYHDQEEQKRRDEMKDKIFQVGGVSLIRMRRRGSPSEDAVGNQVREELQRLLEKKSEVAELLKGDGLFSPKGN